MTKTNDFKGFCLFNDIEDVVLRTRNQAVVLVNLAEDHVDRNTKKVNLKGAGLILGYYKNVDDEDKPSVMAQFKTGMLQRGFALS